MIISTFEYVILDDVLKVDLVKYILSPPFCRNKKKSSEAEMCQAKCSPFDNTPPKWSAKRGYMDFGPTRKG